MGNKLKDLLNESEEKLYGRLSFDSIDAKLKFDNLQSKRKVNGSDNDYGITKGQKHALVLDDKRLVNIFNTDITVSELTYVFNAVVDKFEIKEGEYVVKYINDENEPIFGSQKLFVNSKDFNDEKNLKEHRELYLSAKYIEDLNEDFIINIRKKIKGKFCT